MINFRRSEQGTGMIRMPRERSASVLRGRGSIFQKSGVGLVEIVLVLGAIFAIAWGAHAWHESQVRNYPGPRSAVQHSAYDVPPLLCVAVSPDQRTVVSVGAEGVLRMYDLQTRKCSAMVTSQYFELTTVCFSPDGSRLLVGTAGGEIELWNCDDIRVPVFSRKVHAGRVTFLAYHPDGRSFLTAGDDDRNIIWNAQTLEPLFELPPGESATRSGAFLPAGNLLVLGTVFGQLQLWDLTTRQLVNATKVSITSEPRESIVEGLCILSDETEVLVVTRDGELGIWDARSGTRRLKFRHPGRYITSLHMLANGRHAVSGGLDGQIQIWDVSSGHCIKSIPAHAGPVHAMAATTDSRLMISTGWDGTERFWDL
ncbi:MAG: angio-associated migratory cell protein isoform [Planctomycetaceae bacterium]|nr:angio-associated migratory cell protein isoform [Planctomycetaceae bacterium]